MYGLASDTMCQIYGQKIPPKKFPKISPGKIGRFFGGKKMMKNYQNFYKSRNGPPEGLTTMRKLCNLKKTGAMLHLNRCQNEWIVTLGPPFQRQLRNILIRKKLSWRGKWCETEYLFISNFHPSWNYSGFLWWLVSPSEKSTYWTKFRQFIWWLLGTVKKVCIDTHLWVKI